MVHLNQIFLFCLHSSSASLRILQSSSKLSSSKGPKENLKKLDRVSFSYEFPIPLAIPSKTLAPFKNNLLLNS